MKEVPEVQGSEEIENQIENFIAHYVWHNDDYPKKSFWRRLENRLNEMLTRRKKLLKNMTKKELKGTSDEANDEVIASMIIEKEKKKAGLLANFKVSYLENMLNSSTKSVARDVVSTLIDPNHNEGALLKLM